jgi:DUF1365 family protein
VVIEPALYVGRLRHRRYRPRPHAFAYPLFMAFLDVDRIDETMRRSRLTSLNRFNWAAFDDRDHVGDPREPLRARLVSSAAEHGIVLPDGPIGLLTHLRYLGYAFNPISFIYAFSPDGGLRAVGGEVHNTFGGRCLYWLPVDPAWPATRPLRWRTPKVMHVSPFMGMDVDYEFVVSRPGPSLVAHMATRRRDEATAAPYFDATLTLERRAWTPAALRRLLVRHPMVTAKVVAAIHWEAFRLWWKGLPAYPHPDGPEGRRPIERVVS